MRNLVIFFIILALTACNKSPDKKNEMISDNSAKVLASEIQKSPADSILQYLIKSSAKDFFTHGPSVAGFRDVRFGHIFITSDEIQYLIGGKFMHVKENGKTEWIPFAAIKTSDYEQWLGAKALGFVNDPSVKWENLADLASSLIEQLDSLRNISKN